MDGIYTCRSTSSVLGLGVGVGVGTGAGLDGGVGLGVRFSVGLSVGLGGCVFVCVSVCVARWLSGEQPNTNRKTPYMFRHRMVFLAFLNCLRIL